MNEMKPDFRRFHAAVTREKLPDRVPNSEVDIEIEIMEAFLGQRMKDVKTYASFWEKAGYDLTRRGLETDLKQEPRQSSTLLMRGCWR